MNAAQRQQVFVRNLEKRLKKAQSDLRTAKKALKLADSIMEYCGGDRWERECTADDRKKYDELCEQLFKAGSRA